MSFTTLFRYSRGCQFIYPCFPGAILTVLRTIIFPSLWLLFHITVVETTGSDEIRMNRFAMTTIDPLKKYWPSQLPTEIPGSTLLERQKENSIFPLSYDVFYPRTDKFSMSNI